MKPRINSKLRYAPYVDTGTLRPSFPGARETVRGIASGAECNCQYCGGTITGVNCLSCGGPSPSAMGCVWCGQTNKPFAKFCIGCQAEDWKKKFRVGELEIIIKVNATAFNKEMGILGRAIDDCKNQIGETMLPVIRRTVDSMTGAV